MNLKLSIKDINFIIYLYKFLNIFLITPWYDFGKNTIYRPIACKFYGCLIISVKIFWIIHTMTDKKLRELYQDMVVSQKFIFFGIYTLLLSLSILTVSKSCFWDGENWKTLITNLQYVDEKLKNKGKTETCVLKNIYFRFFIEQVIFFLIIVYQVYVWMKYIEVSVFKIACMSCLKEIYYEFLTITLLNSLVESFKTRYEDVNYKLATITGKSNVKEELTQILQEYRILGESVDVFNTIFGYQLVMIMFHIGLELVNCLNVAFVLHLTTNRNLDHHMLLASACIITVVSYNCLRIVLPIDSTVQEAKKFQYLAYKVQENFAEDLSELESFIKMTQHSKDFVPQFSASGYFRVDKSLIFSIVANVATYFIIAIQLNEASRSYISLKI
ncbi:hypothetical protein Zmor_019983 [Zophobas morio]|uniref:Gustatory receptor n=1 Tax=Zophobas morio TaxID=2755281 RepID=A0AA38I4L0_9CUCU|nr:hypothetical protein Zmor_019983 [Zophobas morio]